MFKKDIEEIKEALRNTLAIKSKMEELHREYESTSNKLYLDMYSRSYTSSIYNDAIKKLNYAIINKTGFKQYYLRECGHCEDYEKILEDNFAKALLIDNQMILDEFKKIADSRHCYEKNNSYTIKNDCIDLFMDFDYYKKIILNTLNILINDEIENDEILEKINEVLKNDNTFVYRNIRITTYKNGKTRFIFADNKTLNKMIALLTKERGGNK